MEGMPIILANREIAISQETVEKLRFLNIKAGVEGNKVNRYSDIINQALKEFFEVKFKELNIEYFIDTELLDHMEMARQRLEEARAERERIRLIRLAKKRMIEKEIQAIKAEEKRTGQKIEVPKDIVRTLKEYDI